MHDQSPERIYATHTLTHIHTHTQAPQELLLFRRRHERAAESLWSDMMLSGQGINAICTTAYFPSKPLAMDSPETAPSITQLFYSSGIEELTYTQQTATDLLPLIIKPQCKY